MVPYNKTCISGNRIGFLALMSFSANLMSHGSLRVRKLLVECKLSQFKEKEPFLQARYAQRLKDRASQGIDPPGVI